MNRCKGCEHWGYMNSSARWHDCKSCQAIGHEPIPGWLDMKTGGAFVDGGDGNDSLYTDPEFGCPLWEPKKLVDGAGENG